MSETETRGLSKIIRVVSRLAFPAALVIFAAPFLVLLFYAMPATDDFCKATLAFNCVPQSGVLRITWLYYTQWSPRWLTTFIQSFAMHHVDLIRDYAWLLLAVIVSNVASLWYFFRTFFNLTRKSSLLVAAVFYSAWVVTIGHPSEELYWLTGATEYFLSISALLVLMSLLYKPRRAVWYYVLVAVLSFAIPAQHEIAGTFLCVALLFGAVVTRIKRIPALQWYVSLSMGVLSQAIVMLSPGNARRAIQEHRHIWDIAHLPKWVAHAVYHGSTWLAFPSFLLAACCIVLLVQRGREGPATGGRTPEWVPKAGLCGMLFIIGEYFLVEMASGDWSPERVVLWFEFVFWLLFVCVILTGVPEINLARFSLSTRLCVYALFAVSLFGSSNFRAALEDLHGPAQSWRRIESLELRPRGGDVEFEVPTQYPHFAMHTQITSDPGCWVNRCVANFLHARSVVAKNSTEECP
jgi:hypothetical protein